MSRNLRGYGLFYKARVPVQLAEDVVKYLGDDRILKQDGSIESLNRVDGEMGGVAKQLAVNAFDYDEIQWENVRLDGEGFDRTITLQAVINGENTFSIDLEKRRTDGDAGGEVVLDNLITVPDVGSFIIGESESAAGRVYGYILKTDHSFWAWGANADGRLGDGTEIDRDEPVQILDNVATVYGQGYQRPVLLKTDGSLWTWGDPDLTPHMVFDDTVDVVSTYFDNYVLRADGSLWKNYWCGFFDSDWKAGLEQVATGVRLPSTTIVE